MNSTKKVTAYDLSTIGFKKANFHAIVFTWFQEHGRDLPWRRTNDPYAIALSEMMLQQTQVDRVIPKWQNFLKAFPTWKSLAAAKTSDVLRLWQGLGYNRRALMVQRLAQEVMELGGELPSDIAVMKKLPGIGDYTAHAIAAFAFHNSHAAPVDTNILRIFRRVFPRHKTDHASMQQLAELLAPSDVWSWNHALMDIGALHCKARGHVWAQCPLAPLHGGEVREEPWLKKRASGKFVESDRYFRGRIIDVLRGRSYRFATIRRHEFFVGLPNERFTTLVEKLQHDGLLVIVNDIVMLRGDE